MLKHVSIALSLSCFLLLSGCKQKPETATPPPAETTAQPAATPQAQMPAAESPQATTQEDPVEAAKKLGTPTTEPATKLPSGLQYIDVKVGDGAEAKSGDTVQVHYTGWLVNGTKFDSSLDRGQPFAFPLGAGRVIKGWDEGVAGMKIGGVRKLIIPSDLGYGARGAPPVIPPDSTLIFEVQLLNTASK